MTMTGDPAALQAPVSIDVSALIGKYQQALAAQQQSAFVQEARAEALARENEALREQVARLEEQVLDRADEG